MPTGPARTADDITDTIRALVDRVVDAKLTQEMARRGQDVADLLAERSGEVGAMANEAWHDSRPMRRDAAKRLARATADASKWSDRTWRTSLRPALKDLWKRRTLAIGAAGAAVPASRELVDTAAARLGLKQREERHWGAFFLGLLIGAAVGAIAALLTTPKRGSEMRHELGTRAEELATKAKDEWVPMFQREDTNGQGGETLAGEALPGERLSGTDFEESAATLQEGAADAGTATGEAAEQAATDTAEAINEAYDTVDRESTS
jgi:gas vesicle protein